MGLQQVIGPHLHQAVNGWVEKHDNEVTKGHSFCGSVEDLNWLTTSSQDVVTVAKKALYVTAMVVVEVIGVVFSAIEDIHALVGAVFGAFGKRSLVPITTKGQEILTHTGQNLERLAYTVTKVILLYTGDTDFNIIITRQKDERITDQLEKGFYLDITGSGASISTERAPRSGVAQNELHRTLSAGKTITPCQVGVGSFTGGSDSRSARILYENLSAQQTNLTQLASPETDIKECAQLRKSSRDEGVLAHLEKALNLGVTHLRVDSRSIWIVLNFIDARGADGIELLRRVKAFDIIEAQEGDLEEERFDRLLLALNGIHNALEGEQGSLPWEHLFFVQTDNSLDSKQGGVLDKVYPYRDGKLDGAQKQRLASVQQRSMQKSTLVRSPLLRWNDKKEAAGIILNKREHPFTWLYDFFTTCPIDQPSDGFPALQGQILNFMGPRAWPTKLYLWRSNTDLARLEVSDRAGLHFRIATDLQNFHDACTALGEGSLLLPVTDIVCDFVPDGELLQGLQPYLSLEKVHVNSTDDCKALVTALDTQGIYTLQFEEGKLVMRTKLAAQDLMSVMQKLIEEPGEGPRLPVFSSEAYRDLSIGEVVRMITPHDSTLTEWIPPFPTRTYPMAESVHDYVRHLKADEKTLIQEALTAAPATAVVPIQTAIAKWKGDKSTPNLKACIKAIFSKWEDAPHTLKPALSRGYASYRRYLELRDRGHMNMTQVLSLFRHNQSARKQLALALNGIAALNAYAGFEAKLTEVLTNWTPKQIHDNLKDFASSLILLAIEVQRFDSLSHSFATRWDEKILQRATKAFGLPVFVPPGHVMTGDLCKVLNETGAPLVLCVDSHTLGHNLQALHNLKKGAQVTLVPKDRGFRVWYDASKKDQHTAFDGEFVQLKQLLHALIGQGLEISYRLPRRSFAPKSAASQPPKEQLSTIREVESTTTSETNTPRHSPSGSRTQQEIRDLTEDVVVDLPKQPLDLRSAPDSVKRLFDFLNPNVPKDQREHTGRREARKFMAALFAVETS